MQVGKSKVCEKYPEAVIFTRVLIGQGRQPGLVGIREEGGELDVFIQEDLVACHRLTLVKIQLEPVLRKIETAPVKRQFPDLVEIVVADDSGGAIGPYNRNALMRTTRVQVTIRIDLEADNISQTDDLRASRLF